MANGLLSSLSFLGFALEATPGTAVAAAHYVPIKSFKADDDIKRIMDDGKRGVLAKDFGMYAGTALAQLEYEGQFYTDIPGYFLQSLFGTATTAGASAPYTTTFQLSNSMPKTLTISDYEVAGTRQYAYGVVEEVGLKWTSEGDLNYSVKMQAQQSTTISEPTASFSAAIPFLGWQGALTLNGSSNLNMIGGDLTIKREIKPTYGVNNTQQFTRMNVGPMEVSGKLDFEIVDYTEHNLYLNNTQGACVITFTQGNNILTLQMSKVGVEKSMIDRSKEMVGVSLSYKGIYNSTDNGPCLIKLQNSTASYAS